MSIDHLVVIGHSPHTITPTTAFPPPGRSQLFSSVSETSILSSHSTPNCRGATGRSWPCHHPCMTKDFIYTLNNEQFPSWKKAGKSSVAQNVYHPLSACTLKLCHVDCFYYWCAYETSCFIQVKENDKCLVWKYNINLHTYWGLTYNPGTHNTNSDVAMATENNE